MSAGCVVIDMKTRRRAATISAHVGGNSVQPSQVDPMTDRAAEDRILHKLAVVLERDLPTLSPSSPGRPDFERMLGAARRRVPADGSTAS